MKAKEYADKFISEYKNSDLHGEDAVQKCASNIFNTMYDEFSDVLKARHCSYFGNGYGTLMEFSDKWGAMCRVVKCKINVSIPEDLFMCTVQCNHMRGAQYITFHEGLRDHGLCREVSKKGLGSTSDLLRLRSDK